MLKRHQASIDLSKNALIIQGREIRFLNEHELPDQAREEEDQSEQEIEKAKAQSLLSNDNSQKVISDTAQKSSSQNLSNQGNDTLNEERRNKVKVLVGLGADEEQAKSLLGSTDWNVELAASLLFSQ
ncbi:hypothetical protein PPACK8108_LOCUS8498 [Phakopsora pachyrhizi]|uniref:UBA domain-containing protein n=1 Tax=Phakopsora pachyrhizi TaxID=170000 RepID=A0AAV0AUR1_PHAPC|nr:hypothetical protein PPACK8108_LOCUS8498 [Phakopsora pachyrhizi]